MPGMCFWGLPDGASVLLCCFQGGSTQKGCPLSWAALESWAACSAPNAGCVCWVLEDGLWDRDAGMGFTAGVVD